MENSQESSRIFNLSVGVLEQLEKVSIDLNTLFLLECLSEGIDLSEYTKPSKLSAWYQTLQRKGLVLMDGGISSTGEALLCLLKGKKELNKKPVATTVDKVVDDFERWWKAFPSTDLFTFGGKTFEGSRGMRTKKEDCRKKFSTIIKKGKYTADDMIRALEYEVLMKKKQSLKEGTNNLKYLHNSYTYLNQGDYENFMEISKIETKGSGGTFNI